MPKKCVCYPHCSSKCNYYNHLWNFRLRLPKIEPESKLNALTMETIYLPMIILAAGLLISAIVLAAELGRCGVIENWSLEIFPTYRVFIKYCIFP